MSCRVVSCSAVLCVCSRFHFPRPAREGEREREGDGHEEGKRERREKGQKTKRSTSGCPSAAVWWLLTAAAAARHLPCENLEKDLDKLVALVRQRSSLHLQPGCVACLVALRSKIGSL